MIVHVTDHPSKSVAEHHLPVEIDRPLAEELHYRLPDQEMTDSMGVMVVVDIEILVPMVYHREVTVMIVIQVGTVGTVLVTEAHHRLREEEIAEVAEITEVTVNVDSLVGEDFESFETINTTLTIF